MLLQREKICNGNHYSIIKKEERADQIAELHQHVTELTSSSNDAFVNQGCKLFENKSI